jgi:DNA-damage-inducible protein D
MNAQRIDYQHHVTFETIRHFDEDGEEFWLGRQLADVLDYSQYRHFLPVIERAKEACHNSGQSVENHIEDVLTMVDIGSGAKREVPDVRLSRYACYLIVQNGDPSKPVIANGQTYFAMQTRRQELNDDAKFARLSEDEKRLAIRNELAEHNKDLAAAGSRLQRAVRRHGGEGHSCPQGAEEEPEDTRPHGEHGAGGQSVSRHTGGREIEAG